MCSNQLSVNNQKTKYMLFHRQDRHHLQNVNIILDNKPIIRVNEIHFLGITITDTLDWSKHISTIANKISRVIGIMSKLKRLIPRFILRTIYNSLILPHLYYGILIRGWDSGRLMKLHKRAVRLITQSTYNAHTNPLFCQLEILKIKEIYLLSGAKFYFKFKKGNLPHFFSNFFQYNHEFHNYNTRRLSDIHTCFYRLNSSRNCIRYRIPIFINNLPKVVKEKFNTHSFSGFSLYIKNYFLTNYDQICGIENCYICQNSNANYIGNLPR